jgi:hypothetical protein
MTNITPFESAEQKALVNYLEILILQRKDIIFTAIPNSTFTTSPIQKRKNSLQGVRKGLPDLFLIVNKQAIFIEMKRKQGGILSNEQKVWIEKINQTNIKAFVCKGFQEAKAIVDKFINCV